MQQRLLFIDDDETLIDVLQYYFPRHFECLCLRSARGIEHHINSFSPHVIVIDIGLKGADGRAICKEIKDHPKFKHIPVILTSGSEYGDEQLSPFQPDGFIQKPYTHLDKLTADIKGYLQAKVVTLHDRRKVAEA